MKKFLRTIFTSKNIAFFFIALFLFNFLDPISAFARTTGAGATTNVSSQDNVLQSLGQILSLFIKMLTFIATFIIAVGGELMGSNLIIGEVAEKGLRHIWVFVRNITNIGFILILIYLAMSNLFAMGDNGGKWNWSIKDKLPKLIIALIAINGSFLAFKVVIQAVDVGTVAILSIADTALESNNMASLKEVLEADVNDFTVKDKNNAKIKFYKLFNKMMCNDKTEGTPEDCLIYIETTGMKTKDPLTKNILVAFGVHFMHLEQLPGLAANIKNLTGVLDNTMFSALMALMFTIALIATFIVMIVRVAALWLFMAFSPLIVAGGIMGFGDGGSGIADKIVNYLIIPLKISAVFALTFIMMSVLGDYTPTVMQVEWLKIGDASNSVSLFHMLWQVMTVVIFWQAAFWAIDESIAHDVVQGIKTGAQKVGGFAAQTATVDRKLFKGVSLRGASRAPQLYMDTINRQNTQKQRELIMKNLHLDDKSMGALKNLEDGLAKYDRKTLKKHDFTDVAGNVNLDNLKDNTEGLRKLGIALGMEGETLTEFTKKHNKTDIAKYIKKNANNSDIKAMSEDQILGAFKDSSKETTPTVKGVANVEIDNISKNTLKIGNNTTIDFTQIINDDANKSSKEKATNVAKKLNEGNYSWSANEQASALANTSTILTTAGLNPDDFTISFDENTNDIVITANEKKDDTNNKES